VIAFGTSHTYGAKLEDRFAQAYPWLLTPDAVNLGIRASSPSYPALCLQTMISKTPYENYDVIILEFIIWTTHLDLLAERLRERYPDALIIFVELWNAVRIRRTENNEMVLFWMERNFPQTTKLDSPEFVEHIRTKTQPKDWKFDLRGREEFIQQIAKNVDAEVFHLPRLDSAHAALVQQGKLFDQDRNHISEFGHQVVARGVAKIINNHQFHQNNKDNSPKLGSWGSGGGDACSNWFETGQGVPVFKGHNTELRKFAPSKYALELYIGGATIIVNNPFPTDRTLYLMYMVMGPPPSPYPKTMASLPYTQQPNVELDTSTNFDTLYVHVTKIKRIGTIPPGITSLNLFPLEDLGKPFRLTGLVVSFDLGGDTQIHSPLE